MLTNHANLLSYKVVDGPIPVQSLKSTLLHKNTYILYTLFYSN